MQLKRYEAPTIKEALHRIKIELGADAVIFSSRMMTSNKNPLKKYVEVMAAVDRDDTIQPLHEPVSCFGDVQMEACVPVFSNYLKNLLMAGFNHETAWYLIGEASSEYHKAGKNKSFKNILLDRIAFHVPVAGPVSLNRTGRKIIAFIGPTGVGKTTTLAKIAARFSIAGSVKVKIITMDTYRIAAAEQLTIYGRIMGLPVNVAASPAELKKEIMADDNTNLVLIDTAGRNFRDRKMIDDLKKWINKYEEIESHLLLSATTRHDVISKTIESFNNSRVDRIIITKIDESPSIGHLYNCLMSAKKPVSYLTIGQKVPEDIKPATSDLLASLFFNGFNRNSVL